MSKKNLYLLILAAVAVVVAAGYVLKIGEIKSLASNIGHTMVSLYILVPALVCGLFLGKKNYWATMLGCGLICAVVVQYLVSKNFGINPIAIKTIAFLGVVYLLNLVRILIGK